MGNCFGPCRPSTFLCGRQQKVIRIVKRDGKILELRVPILVKDLLVNFQGLGVGVSKEASQHLPLNYELQRGKVYHLLPSLPAATSAAAISTSMVPKEEEGSGIKRIKVVITKQQLQELLSKQVSVEEVLSGLKKSTAASSAVVSSTIWKPKLESIPEGSE